MRDYLSRLLMYVSHGTVIGATIYFAEYCLEAWTR